MASMTDMIFLLLIFFMLTSSVVQIRVNLPESDSRTLAPSTAIITITEDGIYKLNGKTTPLNELESKIRAILAGESNKKVATITIAAEKNLPWDKVTEIMRIANDLKVRAIIATAPTRN